MDVSRTVRPLSGEADFPMWKRKIRDLLDYHEGALDVIDGRLLKPAELPDMADEEAIKKHKVSADLYRKANSYAKSMIASTITDSVYQKIMDKETARDAWEALKALFEATAKDQLFKICTEFFTFSWSVREDVSTHIAKLGSLWNELNNGLLAKEENKLPELLLVCKVLHILPSSFDTFRSSWMLLSREKERTFEELATQLSMFERNFARNSSGNGDAAEAILVAKSVYNKRNKSKSKSKEMVNKASVCHYCKLSGHWIKKCTKWIADGRPPKASSDFNNKSSSETGKASMALMSQCEEGYLTENESHSFWMDNGATKHVTNNPIFFTDFEAFSGSCSYTIRAAGNEVLKAYGKGTIRVKAFIGERSEVIELKDVWYVPGISKNLFSVLAAQDRQQNSEFASTPTECWFKVNNRVYLYGTRSIGGTLYRAAIEPILPNKVIDIQVAEEHSKNRSLLQLYHSRWGHQDKRHVADLLKKEFDIKVKVDGDPCEPCLYGKAHRLKFGTKPKATRVGEVVSTDVCGPFDESVRKYKYFVTFKDHYSKYRFVFFLKQKSDVVFSLKTFLAHAENLGHSVKEILSDNGGEFDGQDVRALLQEKGIAQRLTAPYTPQQNGACERENRTIVEMARTLKYSNSEVEFPAFLWAEFINTAAYILNRTGISSIQGKSPHELRFGKKPRIGHMRVVGSLCYVHVPFQKRRKMDRGC